jgi:hypothetical protein
VAAPPDPWRCRGPISDHVGDSEILTRVAIVVDANGQRRTVPFTIEQVVVATPQRLGLRPYVGRRELLCNLQEGLRPLQDRAARCGVHSALGRGGRRIRLSQPRRGPARRLRRPRRSVRRVELSCVLSAPPIRTRPGLASGGIALLGGSRDRHCRHPAGALSRGRRGTEGRSQGGRSGGKTSWVRSPAGVKGSTFTGSLPNRRTALRWQGFSRRHCGVGRCGHVSGLSMRRLHGRWP